MVKHNFSIWKSNCYWHIECSHSWLYFESKDDRSRLLIHFWQMTWSSSSSTTGSHCYKLRERSRASMIWKPEKSHWPFVAWRKENCLTAIATSKIMERGSLDNSYQKQSCACSHECLNLFEQAKHWTLRAAERTRTRTFLRTNQKSMPVFIGVWGESTESPSCLYYKCP